MHNAFISVVTILDEAATEEHLRPFLVNTYDILSTHFSDFEIVLVNNRASINIKAVAAKLQQIVRQAVTVIQLASPTDMNNALVAGLDRANGDYTVILTLPFAERAHLILRLYEKAQEGFDIVYLYDNKRMSPVGRKALYLIFQFIVRHFSKLDIDERTRIDRIISRRALNWLLRMRESVRYMKALFSSIGFPACSIIIDPPPNMRNEPLGHQLRSAMIVITSFTSLLTRIFEIGVLATTFFLCGIIADALLVRFAGLDILGNPQVAIPGWTFLVVFISLTFIFINFSLYVLSFYIASIYEEIKQRPLYVVESIQRM